MSKLAKGDKGLFEAVDGAYYATVLWVLLTRGPVRSTVTSHTEAYK